jgi:endonuclease YncB( thermonuclease family)
VRFRYFRRNTIARSPMQRIFDWLLLIVMCGLIVLIIVRLDRFSAQRAQGIATVVDGDSLVLLGQKLRLEGIDAPEFSQLCKNASVAYPCGRDARRQLEKLIFKRQVECTGWQNDKYGRLLARCSVGQQQINRQMVLSGWAVSYGDYFTEETAARAAKRGVWQGEFERPSTWRKMRGDILEVPHDVWLKITAFVRRLFGL